MRYAGETACAANRQVVCMHWWDRLQPVNARLRAHFFSPSHGRGSDWSCGYVNRSAAVIEFLQVITSDELRRRLGGFPRLSAERVAIDEALDRVLAEDVLAPEDLPELPRSTVDGYAVRAADTFGASASIPALLAVTGAVEMGKQPDRKSSR